LRLSDMRYTCFVYLLFLMILRRTSSTLFPYTTLFRSWVQKHLSIVGLRLKRDLSGIPTLDLEEVENKKNIASTRSFDVNYTKFEDRKSTRLNSSHVKISYAVFCLKKKNTKQQYSALI